MGDCFSIVWGPVRVCRYVALFVFVLGAIAPVICFPWSYVGAGICRFFVSLSSFAWRTAPHQNRVACGALSNPCGVRRIIKSVWRTAPYQIRVVCGVLSNSVLRTRLITSVLHTRLSTV